MIAWLQKHKRVLGAALMALLPLACCIVTCALEGRSIGDVYLPASEWNDELIYYKMVEGIVNFGYPQGYFGFNESHSQVLSFAAWSPLLVWPWVLWGLLFGWNLFSPMACNIVLLSLAVFLFVWLTGPARKQMGILAVLFIVFTPFTRYMLSGMPEVICFAMVIVTLALAVRWLQEESAAGFAAVSAAGIVAAPAAMHSLQEESAAAPEAVSATGSPRRTQAACLIALFLMTALMTLMRPYLIVFMVFPMYFLLKKRRWLGAAVDLAILLATGVVYVLIKKYMSAEYFDPLFRTDFIDAFRYSGFLGGVRNLVYQILVKSREYFAMLAEGFISGLAAGAYFGGFWLMLAILAVQTVLSFKKKQKEQTVLNGLLALCFGAMWLALLLMYKPFEGSKHLVTFIVAGLFAVSLMETRFFGKMILTAAVCVYLYAVLAQAHPYDYQIPYQSEELAAGVDGWREIFERELELEEEDVPGFDNTVVWTLYDYMTEDGAQVMTSWQYLYGLPAGFGVNCCYPDYLTGHFEELRSRYVFVVAGGGVEAFFEEQGVARLAEKDGVILYRLR